MNTLIPVLYDATAVVLLLLAVSRGSAKGFARTTVDVLGHVAAFFAALIIGKGLSAFIYNMFVGGPVNRFLEDTLAQAIDNGEFLPSLEAALEGLPPFVAHFFANTDSWQLESAFNGAVSDVVQSIEQTVVQPAITSFIYIILFVVLYAVFRFLVKRFASGVGLVFKAPLLRPADRFLGGVLGLVQGGITLYIISLAAHFMLYFLQDPPRFFNERVIASTYIWDWVYHFNPFQFLG